MLAIAHVPFSTQPHTPTSEAAKTPHIAGQYPDKPQLVAIDRFSALGASGNISGVGSDKHHSDNYYGVIQLNSIREAIAGQGVHLIWLVLHHIRFIFYIDLNPGFLRTTVPCTTHRACSYWSW